MFLVFILCWTDVAFTLVTFSPLAIRHLICFP